MIVFIQDDDSFYISVSLGEELLEKFMYDIVKTNKKFLPLQAKNKQKRVEMMSFKDQSGVKFLN